MSAIGGGCFLESTRSPDDIRALLDRCLVRTGPDGGRIWSHGDAVLGWRGFHTTEEDERRRCQPVRDGQVTLVWDGRLDNGADLVRAMGDRTVVMSSDDAAAARCPCDAHLVLAAYRRWGADFVRHIVGDFALALWDGAERTLYLARDPFGMRPLYWLRQRAEIWWCSDIAFPLRIRGGAFELDEEFAAGYLTFTEEPHQTPYRGLVAVPPGALVIARHDHVRHVQFWAPEPKQAIRYRSDRDYEEQFVALFTESLTARLRAKGTVMAELSGGLDSSSIVCLSERLIRQRAVEATRLETVSFTYDGSITSDERRFSDDVVSATGVRNHLIADANILGPREDDDEYLIPNPHRCYAQTFTGVARVMQQAGARVLLSGMCGDHVCMHDLSYVPMLAEYLSQGRLLPMHRLAKYVSRRNRQSYWQLLWRGGVWPWLPLKMRLGLMPGKMRFVPPWFEDAFARRTRCLERILLRRVAHVRNPCLQHRLTLVANAVSASSAQRYREHLCIEVAMPYLHAPLVRFLLDIPPDQLLRPGEDRSMQRRALADVLPERVRTRRCKQGPDEPMLRAIRQQWPFLSAVCRESICARLGIVNRARLLEKLERARFGYAFEIADLLRTLSFELWLRDESAARRLAL